MKRKFWLILAALSLAAAACLCSSGGGTPPDNNPPTVTEVQLTPIPESIGTITQELEVVEQGPDKNSLNQVLGTNPLHAGDALSITRGGEGLLDFGDLMQLRLFNDTSLRQIVASSAPGAPLDVRLFLESGGFTGEVVQDGAVATFETPNGAEITILGTEFFVVYNPGTDVATVGNFGGSVEVAASGVSTQLSSGFFLEVPPAGVPGPEQPIPFSMRDFNALAREYQSPLAVIDEAWKIIEAQNADNTPPAIDLIAIDPESLAIGFECPGAPDTVSVGVVVQDESEVASVTASWVNGESSGEVQMTPEGESQWWAQVGPATSTGTLQIFIDAQDAFGNSARLPLQVKVSVCIG